MNSRAIRWAVLVSSVALAAAAVVLAFLLAMTTRNSAFLERHYGWLLPVNLALAALLALVIAIAVGRLAMRLRRGGSGDPARNRSVVALRQEARLPGDPPRQVASVALPALRGDREGVRRCNFLAKPPR